MNVANILKEYLISIGFDVDNKSYAKLTNTIANVDKAVQKFSDNVAKETKKADKETGESTGNMGDKVDSLGKQYVKSASMIATALASITVATVGLLSKVSDMDLGYQKFALHMFLGRDAAREMKIAMDSLGESIEDIAWMPEIRQRYFSLVNQGRGLEGGPDMDKQLRYLRDIRFEFTRLQLEGTYGMRWVAYHMTQYLAGPLAEFKSGMKSLNDWLTERMPEWSDKLARVFTVAFNVARSFWRFLSDMFGKLSQTWDMLPSWAKKIAVALAVAFAPLSPVTKAIGALILLLDDFYAYMDGRKSSKLLAPVWHQLISVVDYVVRGLVAAMVLLDDIFTGKKTSWKDIFEDVKNAWNDVEGVKDPNGDKYAIGEGSPASKPSTPPSPAGKSGMQGFLNALKFGAMNYQSTVEESNSYSAVHSAAVGGDSKVEINVGGVSVHITQPGATAKEVYDSTVSAITNTMGKAVARNTREMSGVYQ